jgi:hypothetical protein
VEELAPLLLSIVAVGPGNSEYDQLRFDDVNFDLFGEGGEIHLVKIDIVIRLV